MSSVVRPTSSQMTRRVVVLVACLFAIIVGQAQTLVSIAYGIGQTPAEFAADSDDTLTIAPYAFSIWGLIYTWLLIYAVRQVLPRTGESEIINRFGLPSIVALFGIGFWNVASGADWEVATIVLIFGAFIALLVPLLAYGSAISALPRADRDRWLVVWPLALLAGWLSAASPVNLITVVTGNGDLPDAASPTVWAAVALVIVAALAVFVTARIRTIAYALPVAWGLIGAFVAEQERNPPLGFLALALAIGVLIASVVLVFRLRRDVARRPAEAR